MEVGLGDGSGGGEDTDEVVVSAGGGGGGMTSLAAGGVADAVADGSFDGLDAGCCAWALAPAGVSADGAATTGAVLAVLPLDEPATISMIVPR